MIFHEKKVSVRYDNLTNLFFEKILSFELCLDAKSYIFGSFTENFDKLRFIYGSKHPLRHSGPGKVL